MTQSNLENLFDQYISRTISPEDQEKLMQLVNQPENQDAIKRILDELITTNKGGSGLTEESKSDILNAIFQTAPGKLVSLKKHFNWKKYAAAAAILLLLASGYWLLFEKKSNRKEIAQTQEQRFKNDIAPGKEGAILTLADGQQIVLDSAGNGKITDQAIKNGNQISYLDGSDTKVEYNTMTTPKGRKFELVLADGSIVTLDAASSIRYPTSFIGNEREVEITGQAYFKVTHNAAKPFIVQKNDMNIQVFGTEFNVNAYDDEMTIKTTLIQGSVKVTASSSRPSEQGVFIKPGQQAQVKANGELSVINNADIEGITAWKNGVFDFNQQDIKNIMRQLSRWYDIDISYEGKMPDDLFSGIIGRNNNISQVLRKLELTNRVHFKIEGKNVSVMR